MGMKNTAVSTYQAAAYSGADLANKGLQYPQKTSSDVSYTKSDSAVR